MRKITYFELRNPSFWMTEYIGVTDTQSKYIMDAMIIHSRIALIMGFVFGIMIGRIL